MFRSILVLADEPERFEPALTFAVELAQRFASHVDVLHVRSDIVLPPIGADLPPATVEMLSKGAQKAAQEREDGLRRIYERLRQTTNVPMRWHVAAGPQPETAAAVGRLNDLTVVARPDDPYADDPWRKTVEAMLFSTGRPMLLLPRQLPSSFGERVAVAWNGSAQAARAVADALPLLRDAKHTIVMTGGYVDDKVSTHHLVEYLDRHEIRAVAREFETGFASIGEALLEHSRIEAATLLVMGAYSHSRLREVVLGGATRDILAAADLPVLMAH